LLNIIFIYETKNILLSINSKTTHMEHLLFTCSTCHGRGTVDISRSPEPWVSNYADCQDCEGKGYRYCDEEIDERIDGVDSLIDGMMVRLADLSKWAMECKRGGIMRKFIPRDADQREFVICIVVIPVMILLTILAATL